MGGTVVPTYLAPDQGWTPPDATPVTGPSAAAVAPLAATPQMDPNAASTIEQQPMSYNNLPADDAANHALAVHHGRLATMLDHVGGILGGNKSLRMTRNADGSVDVQQVDASPADKWGRVAQAALAGLANGFAVGQGPGGGARAAAAGIQGGMTAPRQQQQQVLDQAQKLNEQNQQKKLFDANMALMDQKIVAGAFDNKTKPVEWAQGQQARNLDMARKLSTDYSGKLIGRAKDMEGIAGIVNGNPDAVAAHAGQNDSIVYPMTHYSPDGTADGVDVWLIPPDYSKRTNEKEERIATTKVDPHDPTKLLDGEIVIPKYSMNGENLFAARKGYDLQNAQNANIAADNANAAAQTQLKREALPSENAQREASAAESYAGARFKNVSAELAPRALDIKDQALQNKNTFGFVQKQVFPLNNTTEKSWQLADQAYNEWANARRQGKTLPTGAQSMTEFAQHIANTFGGVKGVRINKDLIQEHLGATSVSDDAIKAFQRITTGDQLSPNQWNAFHDLIKQARDASWRGVAANARAAQIPASPDWFPQDLQGLASGNLPAVVPQGAAVAGGAILPPRPANHTEKASYVQSGNNYYWIEPENLDAAKAADRNLKVIGQ